MAIEFSYVAIKEIPMLSEGFHNFSPKLSNIFLDITVQFTMCMNVGLTSKCMLKDSQIIFSARLLYENVCYVLKPTDTVTYC